MKLLHYVRVMSSLEERWEQCREPQPAVLEDRVPESAAVSTMRGCELFRDTFGNESELNKE